MIRVLSVLTCVGLVACGSKKEEDAKKPAAAEKAVKAADPEPKPEAPPAKGLEAKLLAVGDCNPESEASGALAKECGPFRSVRTEAQAERRKNPEAVEGHRELARRYLTHEEPAVRAGAAHLLAGSSPDEGDSKAIIALAGSEEDGLALDSMMNLLDAEVASNAKIRELYVNLAKHGHPAVREHVAVALGRPSAAEIPNRFEILLDMAQNDESEGPRNAACRRLGSLGDERALPVLEKLTEDPASEPERRTACMAGLVGLWAASRPHDKPSEAAYRLTLKRLGSKPRSESHPPWQVIAGIGFAEKSKFKAAAPWYDNRATLNVLADLAADRAAHVKARVAALRTMDKLEASTAQFKALSEHYTKTSEAEHPIRVQLDKILLKRE